MAEVHEENNQTVVHLSCKQDHACLLQRKTLLQQSLCLRPRSSYIQFNQYVFALYPIYAPTWCFEYIAGRYKNNNNENKIKCIRSGHC